MHLTVQWLPRRCGHKTPRAGSAPAPRPPAKGNRTEPHSPPERPTPNAGYSAILGIFIGTRRGIAMKGEVLA